MKDYETEIPENPDYNLVAAAMKTDKRLKNETAIAKCFLQTKNPVKAFAQLKFLFQLASE